MAMSLNNVVLGLGLVEQKKTNPSCNKQQPQFYILLVPLSLRTFNDFFSFFLLCSIISAIFSCFQPKARKFL